MPTMSKNALRPEEEIFADLTVLCVKPGYIHALACICFRDKMLLELSFKSGTRFWHCCVIAVKRAWLRPRCFATHRHNALKTTVVCLAEHLRCVPEELVPIFPPFFNGVTTDLCSDIVLGKVLQH